MAALLGATRKVDFDGLYRHHAPSVYRYARAVLGNHADAEDVTQQTFLNAYRAVAQGTKPRKAENWLIRIAHNEVRKHFRRAQTRLETELDERLPERTPERSEPTLADVLRALQRLSPTQREALVMREFEGRSYAEIAEIMEMTQSALEAQIFRARRALAEQLEGELTCAEAEDALLRRLDGRLPRRVARRLKAHLGECAVCARFGEVQRRQRALLKGLSVMPIPASLFLFRGEQAAAGAGASAVAPAGSAALGGSAAAAGAGGTGIAAGVAAKAAAVTAAAVVAGGVGYGVAASPESAVPADRKVAREAAVAQPTSAWRAEASITRIWKAQPSGARPARTRAPGKVNNAKAPAGSRAHHVQGVGRAEKARGRVGHTRKQTRGLGRGRSKASLEKKAEPQSRSRRVRARQPVVKQAGRGTTGRPNARRRAPAAEKAKSQPPRTEPPAPPKTAEQPRPKRSAPK
jgi:RNA polymerase sigma factor (sigma-70 family)